MFHNANLFGSCIIHILYTGCAEIKKKIRRQRIKKQETRLTLHEHGDDDDDDDDITVPHVLKEEVLGK